MQTVDHIIDALGGSAHVFRETGIPLTTIESWKRAGHIPTWRRGDLIALAAGKGVPLEASDFPPKTGRQLQKLAA